MRRYDARELKRSRIIPLVKETLLVADFNPLPPISYNCSGRRAESATISYRESRSETKGGKFKNLPPTKGVDETLEGQKIGGKVERGEGKGGVKRRPRVQAVTCNYPVLAGSKAA